MNTVINPSYEDLLKMNCNKFFNQVEYLLDLVEDMAKNHFVDVNHICVGMGYIDSDNSSDTFYLDAPNMFKLVYDYEFVYPRTFLSNRENSLKKHKYWVTYEHLKKVVDTNVRNK